MKVINACYKGFFNWWRSFDGQDTFWERFEAGAKLYAERGWDLPAFAGLFRNSLPIMNVLRYGMKAQKPKEQVGRLVD